MVAILRLLAISVGCVCGVQIGLAIEPKEPKEPKEPRKPKVEIHWVELGRVEGLTVNRSAHSGGDTENDYYPHVVPAMILRREDIAETRLHQFDWLTNDGVVKLYSVTLVLTKDARERLAKSCPSKACRISAAVDGKYWGWDHYTTSDDADVSDRWKAMNYSPCMGLMSRANAESIINAFK